MPTGNWIALRRDAQKSLLNRSQMKIDLHTHILPRDWPDLDAKYGYGGFVRLEHYKPCCARMMIGERVFREITDNVWDPKRRIEEMRPRWRFDAGAFDRAGDVQLLGETGRRPRSFPPVERSHRRSRARTSETVRGPGDDPDARSRSGGGRTGTLRP